MTAKDASSLKRTALFDRHVALGGRMVEFAGYALPVQYRGIVAEHLHTRRAASLFDVSHMGQITVTGSDFRTTAGALETLLPGDILGLAPGQMRYTVLLNDHGGIEDDLIVTRPAGDAAPDGTLHIVVNAGRKEHDLGIFRAALEGRLEFVLHDDRALLAVQGPEAAAILGQHTILPGKIGFMMAGPATIGNIACTVSRSGYTGEDGFEISVPNTDADALASVLLADARLRPAGLGARDSLRLEAGLCLYGHDMNQNIDPVTAGLVFAIGKRRRTGGGFAGAKTVLARLARKPATVRAGITFEGRVPVREGADLTGSSGALIGRITSGTFSPSLGVPIAMGYLPRAMAVPGTPVSAIVRGKTVPGTLTKMPFVPRRYIRGAPGV